MFNLKNPNMSYVWYLNIIDLKFPHGYGWVIFKYLNIQDWQQSSEGWHENKNIKKVKHVNEMSLGRKNLQKSLNSISK